MKSKTTCDLKAQSLDFIGQYCNCPIGKCLEVERKHEKLLLEKFMKEHFPFTNSQALEEAQARVNSFKPFCDSGDIVSLMVIESTCLKNAKKCATIAIEKEIETVISLMKTNGYDFNGLLMKREDLQLIKDQIQNTL